MDFQKTRPWRALVFLSLLGLIVLMFADLFFLDIAIQYLSREQMEYIMLFCTIMLLLDLYFSFLNASNKVAFLKKNALKILVLLPCGLFFRAFSFLRLEGTFAQIPLLSDLFAMEKMKSAIGKTARIAKKASKTAKL